MAQMLPRQASEKTASAAELRLFRKIRDELSDDWFALHSLGLTSHRAKPWAEIDFVLVGPGGVYCLEVKGGRIAREGGEWLFTNRRDETTRKQDGPFAQVGSASAALYSQLRQHVSAMSQSPLGYGVATPDIVFEIEGPDVEPEVVYDAEDTERPFSDYVERLEKYWRARIEEGRRFVFRPLAPANRRAVVDFLRADFDLRPSLRAQIGEVNEELLQLTSEQYAALDGLAENSRVLVRGAAGTGKTLLAVEEARRFADRGGRVLLTCFNRALGAFLKEATSEVDAIHASTIHSLMAKVVADAGLTGRLPSAAESDLFAVFYPELALEVFLDSGPVYDAIVVDEAQDVLRPAYLDVLDAALDGGLARGAWRVFLDPRQNIFDGTDAAGLGDLLKLEPTQFRLTVNCRNTAPIATDTAILAGLDCDEVLKAEGPDVEHEWYRDLGHQQRLIANRLNSLLSGGVPARDIVVLGRRRLEDSCLADGGVGRGGLKVVEYELHSPRDAIRYATIAGFKGLESDVILLVDVEDLDSAGARQSLYVGASRCKVLLHVFLAESVRQDYESLAGEFGARLAAPPEAQPA